MKHEDLARRLARATCQSPAQARDELDELVRKILCSLRAGQPVDLPGLGKLVNAKRVNAKLVNGTPAK